MGYTHNWSISERLTDEEWATFTAYTAGILADEASKMVTLADGNGEAGAPTVDDKMVDFNGLGEEAHETFRVERDFVGGDFCKTLRKPYDMAVRRVLGALCRSAPTKVELSTDDDRPADELFLSDFDADYAVPKEIEAVEVSELMADGTPRISERQVEPPPRTKKKRTKKAKKELRVYELGITSMAGFPSADFAQGFVVIAADSRKARKLAASKCGDEGAETWLTSAKTSCEMIGRGYGKDEPRIVCRDFYGV